MTRRIVALSLLSVAAACGQKSTTGPATTPAASAPAASAEPSEAPKATEGEQETEAETPKKPLTPCDEKLTEFDKVLTEATFECKKDKDCGCFETGLSRKPGQECGGVTDKAAAKKLDVIAKAAKKEACGTNAMCEPWTCDPICENGRCQKGPRDK